MTGFEERAMSLSRRRLLQLTGSLAAGSAAAPGVQAAPDEVPVAIAALRPRLEGVAPITLDERRARVRRAQKLMAETGLEALVIASGTGLAARW